MEEFLKILPFIALGAPFAGFLYTYFAMILSIKKEHAQATKEIMARIDKLEREHNKSREEVLQKIAESEARTAERIAKTDAHLSASDTKTDLVWRCIETRAADILKTFPSDVDKDVLLDKFKERSLDIDEAERLRTILKGEFKESLEKESEDAKDPFCYLVVLGRLEQVLYDLRHTQENGVAQRDVDNCG